MSSRTRSSRPWLWAAAALVLTAGPVAAQPPVELIRGLRENGQNDLALRALDLLDGKALPPNDPDAGVTIFRSQPLAPEDKAALGLERAKCLLEASEEEPDEGVRVGLVVQAKEALDSFLTGAPNHPRRAEGLLAQAKLTALDAREQLNRARRIDVPPPGESPEEEKARDAAQLKQKEEATKARPMFLLASKQYAQASALLKERLDDKGLSPGARRLLEREAFEADLASGINQFNTAETYMPVSRVTGPEREERNKFLEAAKKAFGALDKGGVNNRTTWVARAWIAEVTYEQDDYNAAAKLVADILKSPAYESDEGKRLARFFQLRRNFIAALGERALAKVQASEQELRAWLKIYGNPRRPTPEVFAVRYYLARNLHTQADANMAATKAKEPGATARNQYAEAERLYRALSQTDHDYTARAARNRIQAVRRLIGEADAPVASYDTFEKAQMASIIQLSKLAIEEGKTEKERDPKKVQAIRLATIALLERARELSHTAENPADVTDVRLRLIFFYQLADMPYQAAVLGDHVARLPKGNNSKAAVAGLMGLNGYVAASARVKADDPQVAAEARRADRERAIDLARFLDATYPEDGATDSARYRLGSLFVEDKRYAEAFEALTKVRPGYASITNVRLLEGYVASQLVAPRDSPLPADKKAEVFRRAVADLAKATKPPTVALEADVRAYLSIRCRLASLMFAQFRADPEAERARPGYDQALAIAQEVRDLIPTFDCLVKTEGETKKLNLDGLEMDLLAQDAHARAVYLRARALIDAGNLDEAEKSLAPTLDAVRTNGAVLTPEIKAWSGAGVEGEDATQKLRIAQLAAGVDKTRVDVILAGFRLRVKQGKAAEGAALIDVMVKAGGTIEDNLPVLELLGRELAAQMTVLRKQGKKPEADALGAGLAELLKKIRAVPNLPVSSKLFIGQTLEAVALYDEAIETLKQVPAPDFKDWDKIAPDKIPPEVRGKVTGQIRDYSIAQVTLARALRGKKAFPEAEKMLQEIIGTNDKPGWGSGRLYFRRELAAVYEDKGAATAEAKAAQAEWFKAMQVWTTLFQLQRNRLTKATPMNTPEELKQWRNGFAEAFFDLQRCLVKANQQVLAAQPPEKLQKTMDDVAKRFVDMEKQIAVPDWEPEVLNQYADLLAETPQLLAAYKAAGGKLFLEKKPIDTRP